MHPSTVLIYGATGYSGRLIVEEASRRGFAPILAGRNASGVRQLAEQRGLDWRAFPLDDPATIRANIHGAAVVLHCAGPYVHTASPMLDACLDERVHYVDLTGEIPVLEDTFSHDGHARDCGCVVIPGAGFDVVPTDCLAMMLKQRLPTASHVRIAFRYRNRQSRGTWLATVEAMPRGGRVRRNGELTRVPHVWKTARITFDDGRTLAMTIPWGDISTAWRSTGIPNIDVYIARSSLSILAMKCCSAFATRLVSRPAVARAVFRLAAPFMTGPAANRHERETVHLRGDAWDDAGRAESLFMVTPDAYALTAATAVDIAYRVAAGGVPPGVQTAATAFGSGYILGFEGVRVFTVEAAGGSQTKHRGTTGQRSAAEPRPAAGAAR